MLLLSHYSPNSCQWGSHLLSLWLIPSRLALITTLLHLYVPWLVSPQPSLTSSSPYSWPCIVYTFIFRNPQISAPSTHHAFITLPTLTFSRVQFECWEKFLIRRLNCSTWGSCNILERVPEDSERVNCELKSWAREEHTKWHSTAHRYAKVENTTLLWKIL